MRYIYVGLSSSFAKNCRHLIRLGAVTFITYVCGFINDSVVSAACDGRTTSMPRLHIAERDRNCNKYNPMQVNLPTNRKSITCPCDFEFLKLTAIVSRVARIMRQEGHSAWVHEIRHKLHKFLHKHNKLTLNQLMRLWICGWNRKCVLFTSKSTTAHCIGK